MLHSWAVPFVFATARLAHDLKKLALAQRSSGLNLPDVLAVSVGLGVLRLYDRLQMIRVVLTAPSPVSHPRAQPREPGEGPVTKRGRSQASSSQRGVLF